MSKKNYTKAEEELAKGMLKIEVDKLFEATEKQPNEKRAKLPSYASKKEKITSSTLSDEDLIKEQQKKQKTRRFNVNEKWIPLK